MELSGATSRTVGLKCKPGLSGHQRWAATYGSAALAMDLFTMTNLDKEN
jgi:hypothetical protein